MPSKSDEGLIYRVFRVSGGWCAAGRTDAGISALVLPVDTRDAAEAGIRSRLDTARASRSALRDLVEAVRRYFNGWRTTFDDFPLDLSAGTPFQQRVWATVRRVPYGRVRTYHWIGMEIGRPAAARAIGNAVGANPVPLLVPCHRIVGADGTLGGFSAEGGPDLKAALLELERIPVHTHGTKRRVAMRG